MNKFSTGPVCTTKTVRTKIDYIAGVREFVLKSLKRHRTADWGECSKDDKESNNQNLIIGERLFSVYEFPKNLAQATRKKKIWIITERDRSRTTILFPSDY